VSALECARKRLDRFAVAAKSQRYGTPAVMGFSEIGGEVQYPARLALILRSLVKPRFFLWRALSRSP
jgi:hypothetical protein